MKTNYRENNDERKIHVDADRIINEALLPAARVIGLGLASAALKKLHVPSRLICSMIISVM